MKRARAAARSSQIMMATMATSSEHGAHRSAARWFSKRLPLTAQARASQVTDGGERDTANNDKSAQMITWAEQLSRDGQTRLAEHPAA